MPAANLTAPLVPVPSANVAKRTSRAWLLWLLGATVLIVLFNTSYFSNCGVFILGLNRATRVTHLNAAAHAERHETSRDAHDPLVLSRFSMERFMDDDAAAALASRVRADKSLWQSRNAAMSTLGTASYLDGGKTSEYQRLATKSNPLMAEHYGDLLEDVLAYFQARCPGAAVRYRPGAALPGFHVFHCNRLFSMPVASVHKDMQWNRLKYTPEEDIDTNHTLSFTLALELPPGGGGLYTFEGAEMPGLLNWLVPHPLLHSAARKTHIAYKVGWMVTHNGHTYHMIAPCAETKDGYRITLQGHGVYERNANTWWLYW
jgi:hypothetical protein